MRTGTRSATCPLCDAPVEGDLDLRDHLDVIHDLRDDPGRTTSVADLTAVVEVIEQEEAAAAPPTPAPLPNLRIHDPDADDARWQPIAIGLGGVVLLLLAWMAIQLAA